MRFTSIRSTSNKKSQREDLTPICISNCIMIDCVLLYVSKQSAQHVYRLLELEVKRYLRDNTLYLKDPSLPDSISASLFGILTDLPFARPYRELASSIQNVICLERPSSETCMCHPCHCVGITDLPDPKILVRGALLHARTEDTQRRGCSSREGLKGDTSCSHRSWKEIDRGEAH